MPKSITNAGLSPLLGGLSIQEFLAQHWPSKPGLIHGLTTTVAPLTTLPFLASLESMLQSWDGQLQAHPPDVADEAHSIDVTTTEAKACFKEGMGLLFNHVQKKSPLLEEWLTAIAADLGLPAMTYKRCIVYATPDGRGTAAHFDQNINFVLQLTGTKKWWLAPNTTVEHPSQRHTIGQPVDPELASYVKEAFPSQMPADQKAYVLKPGSLLFVPQGYWHRTEAEGEALSLNFTFNQPSWADLLTAALRSRLLLSNEWRELADGVSSRDPEQRELAEQKFELLLQDLIDDLPSWNASHILGATEGF